ncbi:MAG: aldo/keto reductase [Planctomycetes bacterium]|nr:aldo/keto reductase [Planctomycetota bacterium]
MRQRVLGKTGMSVSELGLGGYFLSNLGANFEDCRRAVHRAVERGVNFIDTAPAYANSEEVVGRIIRDIRAPLIVSTKLGGRPHPFDPRNKEQLRESVQESLRLLGREVIDVLIVHEPDRPHQYAWWTDPESVAGPVLEVLDELKKTGVIRFIGLGGTTATEMAHFVRSGKFDVVLTAFNYSTLFREATQEILPAATKLQMGVILGSPLQQGALAERYDAIVRRKPAWLARGRQEQFLALYRLLDEIGMTIAELSLRFALSNPEVHVVLNGAKNEEQMDNSLNAIEKGPLPTDLLAKVDAIAAMMPNRPFEEPMCLPFDRPYYGPGGANGGLGLTH